MIKLQIVGNLGKDCIVKEVNGKNVINFSVAHTDRYKDSQGNQKEKTTWVECAYWTDRTGVAPYLKKGSQVYVEGIPELRHYQKNDGTPGTSLSLRVLSLQLIGNKSENGGQPSGNGYQSSAPHTAAAPNHYASTPVASDMSEPLDDLPF